MLPHRLHAAWAALAMVPSGILARSHHSAQEVIEQLNLVPNIEKGYYVQTFEDPTKVNNRTISTLIYYLLEGSAGQSVWHRLDAYEVWHYYAGAPLTLSLSLDDGGPLERRVLGPDIFDGQAPQVVVPNGTWQSALSSGEWTLVGTTMAPGFLVSGAEFAPPGWEPRCS